MASTPEILPFFQKNARNLRSTSSYSFIHIYFRFLSQNLCHRFSRCVFTKSFALRSSSPHPFYLFSYLICDFRVSLSKILSALSSPIPKIPSQYHNSYSHSTISPPPLILHTPRPAFLLFFPHLLLIFNLYSILFSFSHHPSIHSYARFSCKSSPPPVAFRKSPFPTHPMHNTNLNCLFTHLLYLIFNFLLSSHYSPLITLILGCYTYTKKSVSKFRFFRKSNVRFQ